MLMGGQILRLRVPTRDLSRQGISFLHTGYVHVGTKCRFQLVTILNNWQTVEGSVVRCQYVEGRVHEIGARFGQPIDIALFSTSAIPRRILLVDDAESILRLSKHFLEQLNACVTTASNGEDAIEKVDSEVFDLILMDIEMPVLTGIEAVKRLRERGYRGQIVAATALTGKEDRERVLEAGFDKYIAKPITKEGLVDLLNQLDDEPLFSSLTNENDMKDLVNAFVDTLGTLIRSIEEATSHQDFESLQQLARSLKGEAGGYGFEPITSAARAVEESAKAASDIDTLQNQVDELIHLCRMARPISV